ncbi:MAG: sugar transferase, partial [Verrucomicrobiia bacterium]
NESMAGNFEVVGVITSSREIEPELLQGHRTYPVLGTFENFEPILRQNKITTLLADSDTMDPSFQERLLEAASRNHIACRLIPGSFDVWTSRLTMRQIAGVPVLGVSVLPLDLAHNRILKRLVDILGAIVGLILFTPVMAVCAYLIYRESPGPVLYRQTRLGRHNLPFTILKLRSMRLDAEEGSTPGWTVENDPRRLRIGEFLRQWNLDELPQFWNVLVGEMSLVGPRPERPEYVKDFEHTIRHYNLRTTVKPGITGWAAIHGLRGNTSLVDRLAYDLYYIENWSLLLDFRIMLLTLLPPKNAY